MLSSCWSSNTAFPLWLSGHPPLLIPWLISCSASPAWLMVWPTFQAPRLPSVSQTLTGILLPGIELLWTDIWEQPHLGTAWGISLSTPPSSWAYPQKKKRKRKRKPTASPHGSCPGLEWSVFINCQIRLCSYNFLDAWTCFFISRLVASILLFFSYLHFHQMSVSNISVLG